MPYLGGKIECDQCGEWFSENLTKCPECGTENEDIAVSPQLIYRCHECPNDCIVSTTQVRDVFCPVCSSPMTSDEES